MLTPHVLLFNASDLVFNSEDGLLIINVLSLFTLGNDLGPLASHALQDSDARILGRVGHIETIGRRSEDGIAHGTLLGQGCVSRQLVVRLG